MLYEYVLNKNPPLGLVPNKMLTIQQIFSIEFLLTTAFILTWVGICHRRQACIVNSIALSIPDVISVCFFLGRSLASGVSINGATLLAACIFRQNYEHFIVYLSAQLLATITSLVAYTFFVAAANSDTK